ncbi:MAG: AMP-binding protein [Rhodospirillales bacterium]|nr:AMP-binding protein [Rhodospirillales bacterium]
MMNLPRRISTRPLEWAAKDPDRPAVIEDDVRWSYGDLAEAVKEAKALLVGLGVWPGDRVLILNENCRAFVALLLACSEIDAWAVTLNARLSAREVDNIQLHCQPRRTFYTTGVSEDASEHARRHGASIREIGMLGQIGFGPLLNTEAEEVFEDSAEQVAAMIYTTGTTGRPKGVMLTHRNLLFISESGIALRGMRDDDYVYVTLPLSHIFGLVSSLLSTLYVGGAVHLVPRFSPKHMFETLKKGISVFQGVPAMHAGVLEYAESKGVKVDAPRLRYLSTGGSPMDMNLKERVEKTLGKTLNNGYGLSETSPTIAVPNYKVRREDNSIGFILPGLDYRFVDPETGQDVPKGDVGELWVKGPNVMKGYYKDPEATERVLKDGWFNTEDLARQDDEGAVFIVGRSKDMIIRSGFNVYPIEVEGVINSHELVLQSGVVGRPVKGNEEVIAFVQLVKGASIEENALKEWLAERVAPYKKPAHIIFMDQLPAAPTGKLLKNKMSEMAKELDESDAT